VVTALEGYRALVTGGGSGIGLAAAHRLAADGAKVTICGRSEARLRTAAEGTQLRWRVCDVTDEEQVKAAVAAAAEPSGALHVAVACAGGSEHLGPLVLADVDAFRRTVDLNVTGTFLTLKHAAPVLVRSGGGSFVGVSSIAAALTHRYLGAYCVGKAGIEMLVRVAADELGPSQVRVNCVRPGLIDTDMVEGITAGGPVLDDYLAQTPVSRVGTVDDIAAAVRYLAGPESTWVTGQVIGVDGGMTLRRGPDYTPFTEPLFGADALRGALPE
jgi:NAD(P)-dependent dehydrogenase (short-subunit alcohol dehydrogenase family)